MGADVELVVPVEVGVARQVVWDRLVDWESQSEWMLDAKSVVVVSAQREGRGVTLHVPTNLFGVTVLDIMRVTEWREPEWLEVAHLGKVITGRGAFQLEALGAERTRITWHEWIDPPLGALGRWGVERLVRPYTARLFARSLRNLADLAQRSA